MDGVIEWGGFVVQMFFNLTPYDQTDTTFALEFDQLCYERCLCIAWQFENIVFSALIDIFRACDFDFESCSLPKNNGVLLLGLLCDIDVDFFSVLFLCCLLCIFPCMQNMQGFVLRLTGMCSCVVRNLFAINCL